VRVLDLELGDVDGSPSLAMSLSVVAEHFEGRIDATAANGVHWGSHSMLVAAMSHFPELDADLEVLESRRNGGLKGGMVDSLWSLVCMATDSLASHFPSLVARNLPDSVGE
jgi:hypothetical protein